LKKHAKVVDGPLKRFIYHITHTITCLIFWLPRRSRWQKPIWTGVDRKVARGLARKENLRK